MTRSFLGMDIGSYHGLPDAARRIRNHGQGVGVCGLDGWLYAGLDRPPDSNFTYAENALDNSLLQSQDDVRGTTSLAANLIWEPVDRVNVGIEYRYGTRERRSREERRTSSAVSFIFDLP